MHSDVYYKPKHQECLKGLTLQNYNREIYDILIETLVRNANDKGVRPGIGGYESFIHYDESPWRQGKPGRAGVWRSGFNVKI